MAREVEREDRRGLRALASDLTGLAERLSDVADRGKLLDRRKPTPTRVAALLSARDRRSVTLGLDLVHPGWNLLLVLFRAHLDGRSVRMARLATDAGVAMTTMLRWIDLFLAAGLAERRPHPDHRRGVLLALTAEGAERMRRQLEAEGA